MDITSSKNENTLVLTINGNIDTVTAPQLEQYLQENLDNVTELIFDFSVVDYISRAGLRVMMMANQSMEECDGSLTVRNVNDMVMKVFEMTGFDSLFTFE